MTDLPQWAMEKAVSFEKDLPSKINGANRVFIRAVFARALVEAEARGIERAAKVALSYEPLVGAMVHDLVRAINDGVPYGEED